MHADSTGQPLIVELDPDLRDDVVEALRDQAARFRRVGVTLAGEAHTDRRRHGKDIRTRALRVVEVLAKADALERAASTVAAAEPAYVIRSGPAPADDTTTPDEEPETMPANTPPPRPDTNIEDALSSPEDLDGATPEDIADAMAILDRDEASQ